MRPLASLSVRSAVRLVALWAALEPIQFAPIELRVRKREIFFSSLAELGIVRIPMLGFGIATVILVATTLYFRKPHASCFPK